MRVLLYTALSLGITASSSFAQILPRPAAAWSARTLDNKTITLQQYKGKPIVLGFFLTTCDHCEKVIGIMNTLQREFGPKGMVFLGGVVAPQKLRPFGDFLKAASAQFPVGSMPESMLLSFGQYGREQNAYYPMLFFIDKAGYVRTQYSGMEVLFKGDEAEAIRAETGRLAVIKPLPATAPKK